MSSISTDKRRHVIYKAIHGLKVIDWHLNLSRNQKHVAVLKLVEDVVQNENISCYLCVRRRPVTSILHVRKVGKNTPNKFMHCVARYPLQQFTFGTCLMNNTKTELEESSSIQLLQRQDQSPQIGTDKATPVIGAPVSSDLMTFKNGWMYMTGSMLCHWLCHEKIFLRICQLNNKAKIDDGTLLLESIDDTNNTLYFLLEKEKKSKEYTICPSP
ncbi:hypothetical protein ACJIZ3_014672 [Penstemon smallii]|uniref:Uncharacterized protein n=1 Tax=Penstemon smallii TaxID=265156 RepID=A0ABD3RL04_9LAMI